MNESKIEIYFQKTSIILPLFLHLLNFIKITNFKKIKFEKFRVIIHTDLNKEEKLIFIRKLFSYFNILSITRVETNY